MSRDATFGRRKAAFRQKDLLDTVPRDIAAHVNHPARRIQVMTSTDQQASRSEGCLASKVVCWPAVTVPENPQASYYRARYYDSSVGRFLREDPLRFTGGINFYAYVSNQPLNVVDPYGLWPSMGDVWNWAKGAKGAWDKARGYAGKAHCLATYYYCLKPTFDNLFSISQASDYKPQYTPDELANPDQNEGASHGAHQIKQCISGNKNCDKDLADCLAGIVSGGIIPH